MKHLANEAGGEQVNRAEGEKMGTESPGWHRGRHQKEGWGEWRVRNRDRRGEMTVGDGEGEKKQCDISETDEARRHGEDERTNEKTNRGASRGAWRQGFFFLWLASKQQVLYPAGYIAVNHLSLPANCMTSSPCSVMSIRPWPPNGEIKDQNIQIFLFLFFF